MRAVCIDFETANRFAESICAVGIAVIENGQIIHSKHWYVKPHLDYTYFEPFNTMIHGIREEDVINAPGFDVVFNEIKPFLVDATIVAHNASFDISVMRKALDLYELSYPENNYLCTYKTALRTWSGLENYKLNTICNFLQHKFVHHNAQEDAVACGKILLSALNEKGVSTIDELAHSIGMRLGKLYDRGYTPCSIGNGKRNFSLQILKLKRTILS